MSEIRVAKPGGSLSPEVQALVDQAVENARSRIEEMAQERADKLQVELGKAELERDEERTRCEELRKEAEHWQGRTDKLVVECEGLREKLATSRDAFDRVVDSHVKLVQVADSEKEEAQAELERLRSGLAKEIAHCDHESEEEERFRQNNTDLQPALHAESRGAGKVCVSMRNRLTTLLRQGKDKVECPACHHLIHPTITDECPDCGCFQYSDDPESRRSAYPEQGREDVQ